MAEQEARWNRQNNDGSVSSFRYDLEADIIVEQTRRHVRDPRTGVFVVRPGHIRTYDIPTTREYLNGAIDAGDWEVAGVLASVLERATRIKEEGGV